MKTGKILIYFLIVVLLPVNRVAAQKMTVVIQNGKVVEGKIFKEKYYFLPEFGQAILKYSDGSVIKCIANIDVFKQTVSVYNENRKDTVSLPEKPEIITAIIGKNNFRKIRNSYYQIFYEGESGSLGFTKTLKLVAKNVAGAYGTSTDNAALAVLNSVSSNNQIEALSEPVKYSFTYEEKPVWIMPDGKITTLSKSKVFSLYPDKKALIEKFIADNRTDLSRMNDIIPLFNFLTASESK
jgi:hypothetical protein